MTVLDMLTANMLVANLPAVDVPIANMSTSTISAVKTYPLNISLAVLTILLTKIIIWEQ